MVFNTAQNYQHPDGFIHPAILEAILNDIGGGGCDALGYDQSDSQLILNNGYTEVPQREIVGDDQRWDLANSGALNDNPQTQLVGQVGFQPSSAQDVALANNLSFPFDVLPPASPPDYNNYEGRRDLLAPWQCGDHITVGLEESTIVLSDSNTHTRVPSSGSNSNSGTGSTLVTLGPVDGVAEHAPGKDDNESSQVDKKEDKGKGRGVAGTPPTPSNVKQWVGAIGTTMQVSPNQSATPPREFLGVGDFTNVDGSALVVAGLTIPESSAIYRRRAVDTELAPPFQVGGVYGGRSLPPVPPPDVAQSHPATTSTAVEPSVSAQHPSRADTAPSSSLNATANAKPASSRKPQAPAPSSRKRKAADSGAEAPVKKKSRPRRRKDPKTSAKKHKHAQQGSEYFTLTHRHWVMRLPTEDENAAQASSSSSGTSSSDEAQVSDAATSNDANTPTGSGYKAVQSEDAVTTQHAAWHNTQELSAQEQAPFRFWGGRDSRRRVQYGPDMLARIARETAIAATSSSNVSRHGPASPNASGSLGASPSSSNSLDVGPRGHGSGSLGGVAIYDRAHVCDTRAGPNEAESDLLTIIAPTPASLSMLSSDPAMRLPQGAVSAPLAQPAGSYEIPHNIATIQPPYAYQQHAPPQHAPAGWYDYFCEMPQEYGAALNAHMMPTAYHPPPPFSWPYFPPAGFYAASLNPSMDGHVNHYSDYEQEYPPTSVQQTYLHDSTPPSNDALYREDGWYYQ